MQYLHGGDVYRNSVEYDFSVNINPLGMPKACADAAKQGIYLSGSRYPDWKGEALCEKLSEKVGVKSRQIILGNGAAELLYALCQFLRPRLGKIAVPGFQEYEQALKSTGAEIAFWELKEKDGFLLGKEFEEAIEGKEDIIFLCNPNNPTGRLIDTAVLQGIAERCERTGTYLCLDECFLSFLRPEEQKKRSMLLKLSRYPHIMVLRAFTKIYGMPGLRLGYACSADEELIAGMRSVLQPWNTSVPAQMAGFAALSEHAYLEQTYELIQKERMYLQQELERGLAKKVFPSSANFLFFQAECDLREKLLEKGILVRSCENFPSLSRGYFRIAVRTHRENQELVRRWREI